MASHHPTKIFGAVLGISILAAITFAYAKPSEAQRPPAATSHFSIFKRVFAADPATTEEVAARLHRLNSGVQGLNADLTQMRVAGRGLGRLDSRLVIFPARDDQNICYTTIGSEGSGMLYCYTPRGADAPPGLGSAHLNVMKMYSPTGGSHVDAFGVVFDDVKALRVEVRGQWRNAPLLNNAFFLEVPNASPDDIGLVEATLSDGSVQLWDTHTQQLR